MNLHSGKVMYQCNQLDLEDPLSRWLGHMAGKLKLAVSQEPGCGCG